MTAYSQFNKQNLRSLRDEMNAVLAKYGMEANLQFEVGNMRFSETEVEVKVKAKIAGAKTLGDTLLQNRAASLGLKMSNARGERLIGYKPQNHKYPFIYETREGKRFKCDEMIAKARFAA
jgi:hypothetical protein